MPHPTILAESAPTSPRSLLGISAMRRAFAAIVRWVDTDYFPEGRDAVHAEPDRVDWVRTLPFVFLHLGCLGVVWTGWSPVAVATAVGLYFVRMFAVTGILHRYFSHKTYRTSRLGQFLLALWAGTAVQRGPLWWAWHHRHHHRHSDTENDTHSPHVHGFWWSHIGWITSRRNFPTDYGQVRDLAKFPELVFLNRFDTLVPVLFAAGVWGLGWLLESVAPGLRTDRWQMLVWGFFVSTTALFHGTSCINSLAHLVGRRRFQTADDSRNSALLAFITLGEGWHNNHHRCQAATRNGFYRWEFDPTYWGLAAMAHLGFIRGLQPVPPSVLEEGARADAEASRGASRNRIAPPPLSALDRVAQAAAALAVATAASGPLPCPAESARRAVPGVVECEASLPRTDSPLTRRETPRPA
jgi:stearoyl-CoA desaturase (delta-9 desaturase)